MTDRLELHLAAHMRSIFQMSLYFENINISARYVINVALQNRDKKSLITRQLKAVVIVTSSHMIP